MSDLTAPGRPSESQYITDAPGHLGTEPRTSKTNKSYVDSSTSAIDSSTSGISPGVVRIEAIAHALTKSSQIVILSSIFLLGYAYGLDATLRNTYQPYATAGYQTHSLLSTVNVLRTVFAAAAQPTAGKLADGFGRLEIIGIAVVFYVVGTIVEATASNVQAFCAGAVLYQLGLTIIQVLVNVVIGDITSTRARLFGVYIPNLHFIITTWVAGNIASAVLGNTTWQWGIGMWAIIFPICLLPFISSLYLADRRARRAVPERRIASRMSIKQLFWHLDTPGVLLLIAIFALILTPFTIAGGIHSHWQTAHVIAPLVIGFLCIPVFIIWEMRAKHPLIPIPYLKDRAVWAPLMIAIVFNFAYALQGSFLFTVLIVAFNFSITAATRISTLYLFTSFLTGPICGIFVYKVRRIKYLIVAGTVLWMVAFGLLIRYRGGDSSSSRSGLIGAEVLLGIAGGMYPYATLAYLQIVLKHEQLAVMTGLQLACHSIGGALGSSVSGAIWTQVLPTTLISKLGDPEAAMAVFANPFAVVAQYPFGTPIRDAIVASYMHVQLLLCITGICLSPIAIGLALLFRDIHLNDAQNLAEDPRDLGMVPAHETEGKH
jgi:SIT family siderophore-iron:H+ symporter-like MFS transporter